MPYLNGVEFIRKIKATPPLDQIPVVVASAKDKKTEYLEVGAIDYLTKPYSPSALLKVIEKIKPPQKEKKETGLTFNLD